MMPLILGLAAVVVVLLVAIGLVFAFVRSGDDAEPAAAGTEEPHANRTPSTAGTQGGPEPVLSGPATRYAASQAEAGPSLQGVPDESFTTTPDIFADAEVGPFKDSDEGKARAAEWGYKEGYIGILQPDGLLAGVVQGRYYVRMEVHLFNSVNGAVAAYAWYDNLYTSLGAQKVATTRLANQSQGWKSIQGKVEGTDMDRVYHRFIFRRGNMVAIVQTVGADTFMSIDPARDIAVIMDDRALGNRAAPTPTPSGGQLPPSPVPTR
jgi:hypothetical protein